MKSTKTNIVDKGFIYEGVLLVHNVVHYEDDIEQYGGEFNIVNQHFQGADIGFDSSDVDGIVLLRDENLSK